MVYNENHSQNTNAKKHEDFVFYFMWNNGMWLLNNKNNLNIKYGADTRFSGIIKNVSIDFAQSRTQNSIKIR